MNAIPFPNIDPIAFDIGPFAVRWYAIAYLIGFVAGWRYCLWLARRVAMRPTPEEMDDYLVWAVIGTILGGRLGYVLFYNPAYFLERPLDALMIWEGGMSFHGGLAGVIISMILFAWARGFSPFAIGDIVAAAAPIGLFFGRIANFINGELYGRASDVPWAVAFPRGGLVGRHPSQLYEALLEGLVLFVVLFLLARNEAIRRRTGTVGGVFMIGYGLCRIFVELFREPDAQLGFLAFGATMGQLLSVPMILLGIWFIARAERRPHPA
jgi:phosphatidylglycerol:prolipoprotein diacylglycerol transferase